MILIQKKRITYVHESYNQFTEGMCVINNFYPKKTDESILISFAAGKVAADCICSTISTVIGDAREINPSNERLSSQKRRCVTETQESG